MDFNSAPTIQDADDIVNKIDALDVFAEQNEEGFLAQVDGLETKPIRVMSAKDYLDTSFPPKNPILEPVLRERDLAMLFAKRGVGKTLFILQVELIS